MPAAASKKLRSKDRPNADVALRRIMVNALQKASPRNLSDPKWLQETGAEGK
jgi:hypothetical protein